MTDKNVRQIEKQLPAGECSLLTNHCQQAFSIAKSTGIWYNKSMKNPMDSEKKHA